jgi:hypothetical protein
MIIYNTDNISNGDFIRYLSTREDIITNVYYYKLSETNFTKYETYSSYYDYSCIINCNKYKSFDCHRYSSLNIIDFNLYDLYDYDNYDGGFKYTMKYKNDWIIFYANSKQIGKLNLNTLECDFIEGNSANTTKHLREFYSKYPN